MGSSGPLWRSWAGSRGILSTATLFAVAHGISMGTPLHLGIGLFLGWLRDRSGSLWPGILLHLGYNATLVLTAALTGLARLIRDRLQMAGGLADRPGS